MEKTVARENLKESGTTSHQIKSGSGPGLKKSGKASRLIVEVVLQLPPKSRSQINNKSFTEPMASRSMGSPATASKKRKKGDGDKEQPKRTRRSTLTGAIP
ncbi:hypothetical protein RSOLAG1IB_08752 [Rhizoctonia solani AG-1 IB]|uniref:Uncharacterized protein n=1 Tax=Thanatephorus cucumeris (strain AG1-IB / isolate 7/3/14) TaxID=1108050 RepID=A0A0B7FRA2_THACB|nr:hypothetical protein RSOLAG1IB_08752 [Rhizoctonia solani AG-1 IB]